MNDEAAERRIRELSNALWKKLPLEQFEVEEALRAAWRESAAELEKDAAIGRLVRGKFRSGNAVPVERCTIRAEEVNTIDMEEK